MKNIKKLRNGLLNHFENFSPTNGRSPFLPKHPTNKCNQSEQKVLANPIIVDVINCPFKILINTNATLDRQPRARNGIQAYFLKDTKK
jgi:hypothetical protein